jgi:hypothetical protein
MSKAKERIVYVEERIASLLTGLGDPALPSTPDSDCDTLILLLQAAELTAVADDLLESEPEIGQLLSGASIALPRTDDGLDEVRSVSLLGISFGLDACGLIALPPAHFENHRGGCISPDPAEAIAGKDKTKPTTKNSDDSAPSTAPTVETKSNDTVGGDKPEAQQFVQLTSADPDEAIEELVNELLDRADRLIDQAKGLQSQPALSASTPDAAPVLNCSTADHR